MASATDMSLITGVELAAYIAVCIFLGYMGMKRTKSMKDYAVAGYKVGPVLLGIALISTWQSISTYQGTPGVGFTYGWPSLWNGLMAFAVPLAMLFVVWPLRKMAVKLNAFTTIDLIGERFQSTLVRIVFAVLNVVVMTMFLVAQYKGSGLLLSNIMGTPFWVGVLLSAVVVAIYMIPGGMWADILTDVFQGVIMVITGLMLTPIVIAAAGGFTGITASLTAIKPALAGTFEPGTLYDVGNVIILPAYWVLSFFAIPAFGNRVMILGSKRGIAKFALLMAVGLFAGQVLAQAGVAARAMAVGGAADFALIAVAIQLLPAALAAFFMVGVIAAMMSSVDGYAHSAAVSAGNDVYKRIMQKIRHSTKTEEQLDKTAMKIAQLVTILVLAVPIYWVIVAPPPLLSLFVFWANGLLAAAVSAPLLIGLVWKKATKYGVFAAIVFGLSGFWFIDQVINPNGPYWRTVGAWAVSAFSLIVVSTIENKFFGGRSLPRAALDKLEGRVPEAKAT